MTKTATTPNPATTTEEAISLLAGELGLEPGEDGYWPVIGPSFREVKPGDLIRFDDGHADLVAAVRSFDGIRFRYTNAEGEDRSCGSFCSFKLDVWAGSAGLGLAVR